MGPRASTATLVEEDGTITRGIEEAAMGRSTSSAGPAVQEDCGYAIRLSAFLDIEPVLAVDRKLMDGEGLDGAVKVRHLARCS
jgi:hypothetical protein